MTQPAHLTHASVDFVLRRVDCASNFAEVCGFALGSGELEAATRTLLAHAVGSELAQTLAVLGREARDGTAGSLRLHVRGDDGRPRQIEAAWQLTCSADGSARRAFVTCTDTGARARTEAGWRESEARYRSALVAGRMGSWETDLVARTRVWSEEGMALFGLALDGTAGRVGSADDEYLAAIHPDDRHLVQHFRALADRVDSFAAEYRIVRPDGRLVWLAGRGLVISRQLDGRAHRLVNIMADVTDRKQADEALATERERLGLALEAGQMGVFDARLAEGTIWWSRQMYTVFGVSPETFVPTPESVAACIHPGDREHFLRSRREAMAAEQPLVLEFRIVRADGSVAWIGHRGLTERDAEGRPVRTFGVAADITERMRTDEALREAGRNKDRFIATLAHELRNPLAPIRNAIGVLHEEDPASERAAWCREVIDRQVAQMSHLLDDLLDVSRVSGGRLQLRRAPLAFASVVAHAVEIARPLVDAGGHTLEIDVGATGAGGDALGDDPSAWQLEGDLTRLAQVFSNLLINAAKYTPAPGRIAWRTRSEGTDLVTSIVDHGIGIAAHDLAHVFDMFGQAQASLPGRPASGLGIGLSLARALVEMHGGRIEAGSGGPGQGSTFTVRLPRMAVAAGSRERADAAPAAAPAPVAAGIDPASPAAAPATPQRRRVLVADDLRDSADTLGLLLEAMGHEVHVAYDGLAALRAAERLRPDVALLDLGMPELDGYEACRRIRETPWGERMTVIAQTGWGQEEDRARTREAGFDHHIVKPVDPEALDALLRAIPARTA